MKRRTLYIISAVIYLALISLVTLPPLTALIDRVEPRIIGMPCMQFFLLFVPLVLAVWLIIWYLLEVRIQDREDAQSGQGSSYDKEVKSNE